MMVNSMIFKAEGNQLMAERVFDAPRELVFKMFTEAEHLKNWWGPRGWDLTVCNIDFRPGGSWHFCMKCVDENQGDFYGYESWGKALYREIVEGEKIVYVDYFSDSEGNLSEEMPAAEIILTFIDLGGKTKIVNQVEYPTVEELQKVLDMGMEQGFIETWDRLVEYLQDIQ
ncbi:SRPBCC domain-containing protein [Halalkalibacterium halodurans]|jgi:uncharacterized protein YndB with AHSA1/START domain|uniref:ATPase n=1 Tax=Halalkalibacterium halodurans TaxID=86665 RepID=A0A0M0KCA6_ALKHA|nr:SRPBCC domain-containing protein [Halalkalibacterium halodurans]MED3647451.1 SRPBCC domain-containing protein [Halalkalibacterium halodurans]TPE70042.1 SRPBCC domain-containing protein [Halalkalibacterium halodurans]